MKHGLSLAQKQVMGITITRELIQTLRIMQMPLPELIEKIQHELSDNPFLQEEFSETVKIDPEKENQKDEEKFQQDFDEEIQRSGDDIANSPQSHSDKTAIIERTASEEIHLSSILMEQLSLMYTPDSSEYRVGEYIIGSLDDDGYFSRDKIYECREQCLVSEELCLKVLGEVQNFEPPGIAACDIRECLAKQLDLYSDFQHELAKDIILGYFTEFQKKKFPEIAKKLNVTAADIEEAAHLISLLEPKPARKYSSINVNFVFPDASVQRQGNDLVVSINNEILPRISYNTEYKNLTKLKENERLQSFFKEKEENALVLICSIEYRISNIQKVVEALTKIQRDFFFDGPKALKPYKLINLSEELNINKGTLSRIVNSKYIDTEWGIVPLRIFFSSSLQGRLGSVVSANSIKEEIRGFIREYQGKKKLSDKMIVNYLNKKGINVARRTVAKYRAKLNILSSFHR